MKEPPTDLDKCLAILVLRRADCSQDEVVSIVHCAKLKVGEVERWFTEQLSYSEAVKLCSDVAIKRVIVIDLVPEEEVDKKLLEKIAQITGDDIIRLYREADYMKAEEPDIESVATQLKDELFVPAPETVPETLLTHDFSRPGPHSFPLREDDFKAIWRNLGYNIREFKVYKESSGILSGDVKINIVVSDYGNLELYCSVEEGRPLFEKLLSALPGGKEQFDELKLDVGKYLTRCRHIYAEIHREATEGTWQSPYEGVAGLHRGLQNWPPPLTPSFANLVYRLSLLYHRTSGEYGLPDKSLYQIRPLTGYLPPFSGLYLGEINLANGPDRPFFPPPPFTKWVDRLEDLKDRHRNMIVEWSLSPAIRELLELFNYCLDLVKALKLDDIIRGK